MRWVFVSRWASGTRLRYDAVILAPPSSMSMTRRETAEASAIPQEAIDRYYLAYAAEMQSLGGSSAESERAFVPFLRELCKQLGLPVDRIVDDGHRYVLYPGPERDNDYLQAIDLDTSVDYSAEEGTLWCHLLAVKRHAHSPTRWTKTFQLHASLAARAEIHRRKQAEQDARDADERARKALWDRYAPAAFAFMRSHGDNAVLPADELGGLAPLLKDYFHWELEPADVVAFFNSSSGAREICWRRGETIMDIVAINI